MTGLPQRWRRYPWHVTRCGRPIVVDEHGRRYYADQWQHPIYEWPDDEVRADAVELWQQQLDYERQQRFTRD